MPQERDHSGSDEDVKGRLMDLEIEIARLMRAQSEEAKMRARDRMSGMAVFYGFFFVLVNALAGMTNQIVETNPTRALLFFDLIVLLAGAQIMIGVMIHAEALRARFHSLFRYGLQGMTTTASIVYTYGFGAVLNIDAQWVHSTLLLLAVLSLVCVYYIWRAKE